MSERHPPPMTHCKIWWTPWGHPWMCSTTRTGICKSIIMVLFGGFFSFMWKCEKPDMTANTFYRHFSWRNWRWKTHIHIIFILQHWILSAVFQCGYNNGIGSHCVVYDSKKGSGQLFETAHWNQSGFVWTILDRCDFGNAFYRKFLMRWAYFSNFFCVMFRYSQSQLAEILPATCKRPQITIHGATIFI